MSSQSSVDAPTLSIGMHAVVTVLGTVFAALAVFLAWRGVDGGYSWKLVLALISTSGIALDFFFAAFTRRYPFTAMLWLL